MVKQNKEKLIENEKFIDDFLNIPKIKRKINIKELKKIYEEQYESEFKVDSS